MALDANPDRCADTGSSLSSKIRAGKSWAIRRKGVQVLTSVTVSPNLSLSLRWLAVFDIFLWRLALCYFQSVGAAKNHQDRAWNNGSQTSCSSESPGQIGLKCSFQGPYPQNVDFRGCRWGSWISILKQAPEVILSQVFGGHCFEKQWPGRRSNLGLRIPGKKISG